MMKRYVFSTLFGLLVLVLAGAQAAGLSALASGYYASGPQALFNAEGAPELNDTSTSSMSNSLSANVPATEDVEGAPLKCIA